MVKRFVATGIPSDNVIYKGVEYIIGQANNALIYPGLGLGVLASEASLLTDEMIGAAAHSLSGITDITNLELQCYLRSNMLQMFLLK